jgi:hypothetical protein
LRAPMPNLAADRLAINHHSSANDFSVSDL